MNRSGPSCPYGFYGLGSAKATLFFLFALGLTGCFGGDDSAGRCPNMPIATGVLGQADFRTGTSNAGGISRHTLSGPFGSIATNGGISYIADTANNRVLGYLSPPSAIGAPANFELGQGDATGTDFTGRAPGAGPTSFSAPSKATVSGDDRLVVADTGNNRVLIWNTSPTANTPPDVVVGQADFTSFHANQRLSAPTAATLNAPTAATIANGMLIVADRGNNRVLIWNTVPTTPNAPADVELGQMATSTTGDVTTVCADNSGPEGFCFTTAVAGGDIAEDGIDPPVLGMSAPSDIWTDGYRLLVADSGNHRVLYWSQVPFSNNALYAHVIGQTGVAEHEPGSGSQRFNQPWGLSVEGATLFVADAGNHRVLAFSGFPLQNSPAAFGVFGQADFLNAAANDGDQNGVPGGQDGMKPAFNTLNFPIGVHAMPDGRLFIADYGNNRVLTFATASAVNGSAPSSCNGTNPQVE